MFLFLTPRFSKNLNFTQISSTSSIENRKVNRVFFKEKVSTPIRSRMRTDWVSKLFSTKKVLSIFRIDYLYEKLYFWCKFFFEKLQKIEKFFNFSILRFSAICGKCIDSLRVIDYKFKNRVYSRFLNLLKISLCEIFMLSRLRWKSLCCTKSQRREVAYRKSFKKPFRQLGVVKGF